MLTLVNETHIVLRLSLLLCFCNGVNPIIEQSYFRKRLTSILAWFDADIILFFVSLSPSNIYIGSAQDILWTHVVFTNYLHGQYLNQILPLINGDCLTESAQDTRKEVLKLGLFGFILVKRKRHGQKEYWVLYRTFLQMLPQADMQKQISGREGHPLPSVWRFFFFFLKLLRFK